MRSRGVRVEPRGLSAGGGGELARQRRGVPLRRLRWLATDPALPRPDPVAARWVRVGVRGGRGPALGCGDGGSGRHGRHRGAGCRRMSAAVAVVGVFGRRGCWSWLRAVAGHGRSWLAGAGARATGFAVRRRWLVLPFTSSTVMLVRRRHGVVVAGPSLHHWRRALIGGAASGDSPWLGSRGGWLVGLPTCSSR